MKMVKSDELPYHERSMAQEIQYILYHAGRPMKKDEILAIIFLADRYHLRKYGRPITRRDGVYIEKSKSRPPINTLAEGLLDSIAREGGLT